MRQTSPDIEAIHPALDAKALLGWYDRHARTLPWRTAPKDRAKGAQPDPYSVWLSEIMLQQTTVQVVGDYFHRFLSQWPSVGDLAAAPLDDVLAAWAGLGYYARARNLHACAITIADKHNGVFPQAAAELETLSGIGPYTAAAIAAICYDEKVAVVDGNVDRVMARYLALPTPVRDAKPLIKSQVQRAVPKRAGDFAQAMMDLGASLCAPRAASCVSCPLEKGCAGAANGNPTQFPIKAPKPERPVRFGHAFVITNSQDDVWLQKRPEKGLLAKMTEVPGTNWADQMSAPVFPVTGGWIAASPIIHVFTHFRLELNVWKLQSEDGAPLGEGWWANPDQVKGAALPSLFRKVLASANRG